MFLNHAINFILWLSGVLSFLGCIGGLLFLGLLVFLYCTDRGQAIRMQIGSGLEFRCGDCEALDYCDAAWSGVAFPCAHFEQKEDRKSVV